MARVQFAFVSGVNHKRINFLKENILIQTWQFRSISLRAGQKGDAFQCCSAGVLLASCRGEPFVGRAAHLVPVYQWCPSKHQANQKHKHVSRTSKDKPDSLSRDPSAVSPLSFLQVLISASWDQPPVWLSAQWGVRRSPPLSPCLCSPSKISG